MSSRCGRFALSVRVTIRITVAMVRMAELASSTFRSGLCGRVRGVRGSVGVRVGVGVAV